MIQIEDLCFRYKKKPVFEGLSLRFTPGHVYGLLGKNGAGKSTLLRSIAGLLYPGKGTIRVDGQAPTRREPGLLQDIFLVPEEFHLPDVSIDRFLKDTAPFYQKFDRVQFESFRAAFDIPSGATLQAMSYGQKKKVLISFALATNARYLLMDEPTNGLDILSKSQFRKVLAQSLDEDRCMVISTHQVKDLENLIDRVTVIDEGKILFDEDVETITRQLSFRHSYDPADLQDALYAEQSLKGNVIVAPNESGDETKIDLELLYKAIVTNSQKVKTHFEPSNQLHASRI
ncbi:ATP-binding cassette domain-containing protein [Paraflavisolibacter sp. H34]|uniref:ABC transporter ATP-binding protein n=1 Tax=Huijunlia imazamoxiresistens TaxID=3127457 RepID=UPI00301B5EA2